MRKSAILPLLLLVISGIFFSYRLIAEKKDAPFATTTNELNINSVLSENNEISKSQAILLTALRVLKDGHYSPKNVDDNFSKKVFNKFLERLDYTKWFFTQQDINQFKNHETTIDNELIEGSTATYDDLIKVYNTRLTQAETRCANALANPFTFTENDKIELDGKKLAWCATDSELDKRWYLNMKYRAMARYNELVEAQKTAIEKKTKDYKVLTNAKMEDSARITVKKNMDGYFKRIKKQTENDKFAAYINSITSIEDPHTDFFPPKDKEKFDQGMSGTFIGIGAVLSLQDGQCKIQEIITGSPCWKEGRLKVGDIIQKVAQGKAEPVDISGWDLDDVVSIIRGEKGTEVKLTVKHLSSVVEVISIIRNNVEVESTFAKSTIILADKRKIGYILLPEFYADFNEAKGRRCAKDIKIEIEKLKSEKVDAIILDLRYNGGGSLSDVVEIGGMFIDRGPIVQVRSKGLQAQSMNDNVSGALFDAPLAILINQGSASASEILAAAMQDYNRAIIIGTQSFGKGTVQRIISLDDYFEGHDELKPFGALKITVQKFYRINGGSTQLKGVMPNIILPDNYELMDLGERKDPDAMQWDQVAQADYKTLDNSAIFQKLVENSKARIAQNPTFNLIKQNATLLKKQSEDNSYPLNLEAYKIQLKETKELVKKFENVAKNKSTFSLKTPLADTLNVNRDTVSKKKNADWYALIQKDAYIGETVNVLKDWLAILNTTTKK